MKKFIFRIGETVQVFSINGTTNKKISGDPKEKIVQTYTFSRKQFEIVRNNISGAKTFFNSADTNCLDCPFNSYGKCYTHKFNQYVGFKSMLRSIIKEFIEFDSLPEYTTELKNEIVKYTSGKYIRFGTYGEPSLHPLELITECTTVAKKWTGYTHQWQKSEELNKFFMASTHTKEEETKAQAYGYKSFVATKSAINELVNCPASKEAGFKSTCAKCGLCSGTLGSKSKKSIYILEH